MDLNETEMQFFSSVLVSTLGFFYCFLTHQRRSSRAPNQFVRDNLRIMTSEFRP